LFVFPPAKPEADSVVSPSKNRPVLYSEGNTKQRKRDKKIKKGRKLEKKEEEKLFEDVSRDIVHTLQRRPLHFRFLSLGKNYYKIVLSSFFFY
jgi:hypothetical protein